MTDRQKIIEEYADYEPYAHDLPCVTIKSRVYLDTLEVLKDSVSKRYADQIRWEKDVALRQLADIGKGFGERMDDIIELLGRK